jgi:hypothetical protein
VRLVLPPCTTRPPPSGTLCAGFDVALGDHHFRVVAG